MSWKLQDKVWELKADPLVKLVLLAIAKSMFGDEAHAIVSIGTIVELTNLSERTVRRKVQEASEEGLLVVRNSTRKGVASSFEIRPGKQPENDVPTPVSLTGESGQPDRGSGDASPVSLTGESGQPDRGHPGQADRYIKGTFNRVLRVVPPSSEQTAKDRNRPQAAQLEISAPVETKNGHQEDPEIFVAHGAREIPSDNEILLFAKSVEPNVPEAWVKRWTSYRLQSAVEKSIRGWQYALRVDLVQDLQRLGLAQMATGPRGASRPAPARCNPTNGGRPAVVVTPKRFQA
jgi:hypothetical protein